VTVTLKNRIGISVQLQQSHVWQNQGAFEQALW